MKVKKFNFFFICIVLILYHYLIPLIKSDIDFKSLFFLSLGYPSDPVVLPLVIDFKKFIFTSKYHFSNNLYYFPEFLIYKLFNFNYIWMTAILYKIIYFFVIIGTLESYNCKNKHKSFYIFALIILILVVSNFGGNSDRLVRPSLLNIFEAILILNLYRCYFNKKILKLDSLIIGFSSASTLSMAPWNFFFIIPLFLINIKNINIKNFLFFFITFFIVYFPNLLTNYNVLFNQNLHLEYLGIKEIYNIKYFLKDFIIEALKTKKIILGLIIILAISILKRKKIYIGILFSSIIFGFLPYIILSKTILSYHILQGMFDFIFFTCIFICYKFLNQNNTLQNIIHCRYLTFKVLLILIILIYPTIISNSWILRSEILKKNYSKHFKNLDKLDTKTFVVSNDKYIRFYLYLNSRQYLPEDGYFNTSLKKATYSKIANILTFEKKNNDNLLCRYLKSATENLFDTTRSTKAKTINYKESNHLNSVSSWVLTIPENVKNEIYQQINSRKKNYYYYDDIYGYISPGAEENKCKLENN